MKSNPTTKTLLLGISLATVLTTALAQPYTNATWTIDENGPALFDSHSGVVGYSNGVLQRDPISGVTTLYYQLAGPNVPSLPGDVVLLDPPSTFQGSDLLRFDGRGGVYFFSDVEPGEANTDLADVGVPLGSVDATNAPVLFFTETGPEGNNGYLYTPAAGQPGYDTSGVLPGVHYNIISDVVPEPGSAVLLLIGGALWGLRFMRRKNHA
jgi:hypothetical protein